MKGVETVNGRCKDSPILLTDGFHIPHLTLYDYMPGLSQCLDWTI